MLQIKNISLKYNEKVLFENFSYDFKPNNIYHISGQNGSGKTNLLNIISQFNEQYRGDVLINDKKQTKITSYIYYAMSNPININWFTLKENINLIDIDQIIVENLLNQFDLKKYLNFFPNEVSQGMCKKIDIIRMLASQRNIMISDDPFLFLDDISANKVSNSIYQYNNQYKNIIILAGNDERIKKIADISIKL